MDIIQDLIITNRKVYKSTMLKLKNNPELLVIGVPYIVLLALGIMMASSISLIGGLLLFIIESAVFSSYLYVVSNIISTGKFHMDDVKIGFRIYFRKIYIILLLFYFLDYGLSLFVYPILSILPFSYMIVLAIKFGIILIFNPLPEMIYQEHHSEMDTIKATLEFSKNNIVTWFVPNVIFMAIIWVLTLLVSSVIMKIMPSIGGSVGLSIQILLSLILVQAVIGSAMVYRGTLFNILITTSRRKRLFKKHMDN
jgi:hypothetical protein